MACRHGHAQTSHLEPSRSTVHRVGPDQCARPRAKVVAAGVAPMKLLPGAVVACLLLVLLTWLLVRGLSTDTAEYSATLRTFDDFALAEASLHRDVLMARAGLLQDYDPVNAAMAQIDSAVALLRSEALKDGLGAAPV